MSDINALPNGTSPHVVADDGQSDAQSTADHDDDGFQTATSNIQGVGGIISHLYQVSTPALLAASWGGLVRDGKNAEASTVEQMGKAVYGQDAFQREMDVAVING